MSFHTGSRRVFSHPLVMMPIELWTRADLRTPSIQLETNSPDEEAAIPPRVGLVLLMRLHRNRSGSITPIIRWLQYADHKIAAMCRSLGAFMSEIKPTGRSAERPVHLPPARAKELDWLQ